MKKNFLVLLALCFIFQGCIYQTIPGVVDQGKGKWSKLSDSNLKYNLKITDKDNIVKDYQNKNETWRTNSYSSALFYLADIAPSAISFGDNSAEINLSSENIELTINNVTYTVKMEYYKGIYFPSEIVSKIK